MRQDGKGRKKARQELEAQQAKMTDATMKLLSVVSEMGEGPLIDSPGLTENLLTEWLGAQEDRGTA